MNKRWNGRIAWQASISRSTIDRSLENGATITSKRSESLRSDLDEKQWKWAANFAPKSRRFAQTARNKFDAVARKINSGQLNACRFLFPADRVRIEGFSRVFSRSFHAWTRGFDERRRERRRFRIRDALNSKVSRILQREKSNLLKFEKRRFSLKQNL